MLPPFLNENCGETLSTIIYGPEALKFTKDSYPEASTENIAGMSAFFVPNSF